MISARQLRAARAHLDISQDEVAAAAGITKYTLSNIERGATDGSSKSFEALQIFYESRGLQFTEDDGVRVNQSDVKCYEGAAGFLAFMNDVVDTLTRSPGVYCVSNVNENNWIKWLGMDEAVRLRDRIAAIPGIRAHILVKQGDRKTFATYAEYREIGLDFFYEDTSYYVYADKLALIRFDADNVTVRVLHNHYFTDSFKLMFYRFWDLVAVPITPGLEKRYA